MTDIEMLPLPDTCYRIGGTDDQDAWDAEQVTAHARAVAEHNVKALQAELDNRWATGVHSCHDKCQRIACVLRRQRDFELNRAERLEETLRLARDLVEDWAGYASEYFQKKHNLEGDLALLDAALRDHDQEVRND